MPNNSVSVVIPLFNEAMRIDRTLERIEEYSKDSNWIKEIILVDDGSTDEIISVLQSANIRLPHKILRNEINRGKGFSVKRGVEAAEGDYILFMDADNSVDISYLDVFMRETINADIVVGSIEAVGHRIMKDENHPLRRTLGRISKKMINLLAVKSVKDTQRGFKLFHRAVAEAVFARQKINRFGFDIEILLIAEKHDFKIKEMPVVWNNPKSTSINLMSYFSTLAELFRIKWNEYLGRYN